MHGSSPFADDLRQRVTAFIDARLDRDRVGTSAHPAQLYAALDGLVQPDGVGLDRGEVVGRLVFLNPRTTTTIVDEVIQSLRCA